MDTENTKYLLNYLLPLKNLVAAIKGATLNYQPRAPNN